MTFQSRSRFIDQKCMAPCNMAEIGVQTDNIPFTDVCEFLKKFRNDWIPMDRKAYNLILCTLSVILSIINFGILLIYLARYELPRFLDFAYGTAAIYCAYELYQGLNNNIPQKFFFWFLLKFFEGCLQVVTFISVIRRNYYYHIDEITVTCITIFVHVVFVYYIMKRAKEAKRNAALESQQVELNEILLKNNLNNIKNIK